MVNQVWGRHVKVVTGGQDSSKQVSQNEWNDDLNRKGLLGFSANTLAGASSVTIPDDVSGDASSFIKLSGSTSVDKFITTNTSEGDLLYVITTGSVTLNNTSSPSSAGQIRLLSDANKDLSTTVPTILMRISDYWYEYGGGITNALNDIGDVNITSVANEDVLAYDSTSSKWINQTADESGRVTASSTNTFTNKTIDADGTGNSITNIENADIKASAGIDATKIADGSVTSAEFQYINTLTSNAQTQINGKQATLTFGIADDNAVEIDDADVTSTDYAKFTANGLQGRSATEVKTDLSLNNVENTAISTFAGTSNILTVGTIGTGTWQGTAIADGYLGTGINATKLADGTVTNAELQYINTLSSNAQTQLDAKQSTTLASAKLLVGNGSNVATAQTVTGDIAIDNAGATTIQAGAVDIAMITASGSAGATTFLRGDGSWQTAGGGAENTVDTKLRDEADTVPTYTSRTENDASTPIQLWAITLDSNNENIYVRVKKNGSYTNVQIA